MVRNWQMIVFLCRLYSIVVTHNICMCTHIRRPQAYLGRKGTFINKVLNLPKYSVIWKKIEYIEVFLKYFSKKVNNIFLKIWVHLLMFTKTLQKIVKTYWKCKNNSSQVKGYQTIVNQMLKGYIFKFQHFRIL